MCVCVCVCVQSVKEAVRESLMTYLDSKATPFTISSLITSEEVMSAVWEGVRGEVGEGQRAEVERELRVLAKSLPESGLVVPAQECPSSTYEVRKYCCIRAVCCVCVCACMYVCVCVRACVCELKRSVYRYYVKGDTSTQLYLTSYGTNSATQVSCAVLCDSRVEMVVIAGVAHCGVPRQWIVEHVQGRERLRQVPAATVTTAISHMEEESVIFSVSEGAYKTVS